MVVIKIADRKQVYKKINKERLGGEALKVLLKRFVKKVGIGQSDAMIFFRIACLFLMSLFADDEMFEDEATVGKGASDVHGFGSIAFKNDYITPRGLLVSNTGLTTQVLVGLVWDAFKMPNCPLRDVSFTVGVWNDLWSEQHDPFVGSWNELDWFAGLILSFQDNWKFTASYIEFLSPPHHFTTERNGEFTLYYDDSKGGFPIVINPYAKLWWAISGDSTIVVGKHGRTYYVELGMLPTWKGDIVTLTAPTWISMGPKNFWNGSSLALKNVDGHFGVFSTGLNGSIPLKFISTRLGNWYIDAGVQYYYLINKNLLQAQTLTLGLPFGRTHRNVVVAQAEMGFSF